LTYQKRILKESRSIKRIISQCVELVGSELVKELLPRLDNPTKFLESIIDTKSPKDFLGEVVTHGRLDSKWGKIINSVPPELVLSFIKLDHSLWGDY
jgi:hypothetical protein